MFSFFKKEKKAVFIDWLKKNKYYDKFIEISDLEKLSLETDPKYFFYQSQAEKPRRSRRGYKACISNNFLL